MTRATALDECVYAPVDKSSAERVAKETQWCSLLAEMQPIGVWRAIGESSVAVAGGVAVALAARFVLERLPDAGPYAACLIGFAVLVVRCLRGRRRQSVSRAGAATSSAAPSVFRVAPGAHRAVGNRRTEATK